jgi:hypothetical protein
MTKQLEAPNRAGDRVTFRRMLRPLTALAFIVAASLPPPASSTAAAPKAASAPPAPPPDLVKLKDGSLLRGTIVELKAKEFVQLALITGEVRRIPMDQVDYAGPASGQKTPEPAAPAPPAAGKTAAEVHPLVAVNAGEAPLTLSSKEPDVTFHIRSGEAQLVGGGFTFGRHGGPMVFGAQARSYTQICTAPCSATLPTGTHRLALSQGNGPAVEVEEPVTLSGPSSLEGTYVSYKGTRIAGWLVFAGSLVAGTALMLSARSTENKQSCYGTYCSTMPETSVDSTQLALGGGVMVVGSLVGVILALKRDEASIQTSSQAAAASGRPIARRGAPKELGGDLRYAF